MVTTVWIYVDANKQIEDNYLKVFVSEVAPDAALDLPSCSLVAAVVIEARYDNILKEKKATVQPLR